MTRSLWRANGALAAINQAIRLGLDRGQLVNLESEVKELLSLLSKSPRLLCNPTVLPCWEEVLYKDSVSLSWWLITREQVTTWTCALLLPSHAQSASQRQSSCGAAPTPKRDRVSCTALDFRLLETER